MAARKSINASRGRQLRAKSREGNSMNRHNRLDDALSVDKQSSGGGHVNIQELIGRHHSSSQQPVLQITQSTQRKDTLNQSFNSQNSGGFTSKQDGLLAKLKQQEKLKELN